MTGNPMGGCSKEMNSLDVSGLKMRKSLLFAGEVMAKAWVLSTNICVW